MGQLCSKGKAAKAEPDLGAPKPRIVGKQISFELHIQNLRGHSLKLVDRSN
jgi:hypothetical protein